MNTNFTFRASSINNSLISRPDIESGFHTCVPQRNIENTNNLQESRETSSNIRTELTALPRPFRRNETIENPVISRDSNDLMCRNILVGCTAALGVALTTAGGTILGLGIKGGIKNGWGTEDKNNKSYVPLAMMGGMALTCLVF